MKLLLLLFGARLLLATGALSRGAVRTTATKRTTASVVPTKQQSHHHHHQRRHLGECENHLQACQANLANYSLPLLIYEAAYSSTVMTGQNGSSSTTAFTAASSSSNETTQSDGKEDKDNPPKKDDKEGEDDEEEEEEEEGEKVDGGEEEKGLATTILNSLLLFQTGVDGPIRSVLFSLADLGDGILNEAFRLLNIPTAAFDPIVTQLPQVVYGLRFMMSTLQLGNVFPVTNVTANVTNVTDADDVVELLHTVVNEARETGIVNEDAVSGLATALYDSIFALQPRDVAAIITLPFFIVRTTDNSNSMPPPPPGKDGDKHGKPKGDSTTNRCFGDVAPTPVTGLPLLLGVPIVALVSHSVLSQFFPNLLPAGVVPELPIIDRLFFSNADADVFADQTMAEVQSILTQANITGGQGMFSNITTTGTSIVSLFMNRTKATTESFADDPVSTAVRVVVASALTSQRVLQQVAPLVYRFEEDATVTVLSLFNATNTTEPVDAANNVRAIVQGNYPSIVSYGDFYVSVTKSILDTAVPGYFTGTNGDRPIQNIVGGFFELTDSCEVDLRTCDASLLLAKGLTRDKDDDSINVNNNNNTQAPEGTVDPLDPVDEEDEDEEDNQNEAGEGEGDSKEPAVETPPENDEENDVAKPSETVNAVQEQSSCSRLVTSGLLLMAAAIAVAF